MGMHIACRISQSNTFTNKAIQNSATQFLFTQYIVPKFVEYAKSSRVK